MRFIQSGPICRAPTQTRRPINPRSLHQRQRPQHRHTSDSTKNRHQNPAEHGKPEKQPSQSNAANIPTQPAAAAGAATAPTPSSALVRSRGVRDVIMAGPVGRFGRWYARAQERKPYATQIWSSIIIYLCGDLSAQILFPSEVPAAAKEDADVDADADENEDESGTVLAGYDPYRTLRHLCVGVGSSIPSYKW